MKYVVMSSLIRTKEEREKNVKAATRKLEMTVWGDKEFQGRHVPKMVTLKIEGLEKDVIFPLSELEKIVKAEA